jgi:hypothetical protein
MSLSVTIDSINKSGVEVVNGVEIQRDYEAVFSYNGDAIHSSLYVRNAGVAGTVNDVAKASLDVGAFSTEEAAVAWLNDDSYKDDSNASYIDKAAIEEHNLTYSNKEEVFNTLLAIYQRDYQIDKITA